MSNTLGALNPLRYRSYVYDTETGYYYLQSRYYDPEIGRFINADGYVSTGQGLLGNNMFAYCNNNPVIYEDASGHALKPCTVAINDGNQALPETRDVTDEVTAALEQAVIVAQNYRAIVNLIVRDSVLETALIYSRFYALVNHHADWDIKRPEPWERTIGTRFPGQNVPVQFEQVKMTPENLGNFTYGVLGYAHGIPLEILVPASWYAAGFPLKGEKLNNEIYDWFFISLGYEYAQQVYP